MHTSASKEDVTFYVLLLITIYHLSLSFFLLWPSNIQEKYVMHVNEHVKSSVKFLSALSPINIDIY